MNSEFWCKGLSIQLDMMMETCVDVDDDKRFREKWGMRSSSFPLISTMSSLIIYAYDETIQQYMVCFEVSGFGSFLKILGMESILYKLFVLQDTYHGGLKHIRMGRCV